MVKIYVAKRLADNTGDADKIYDITAAIPFISVPAVSKSPYLTTKMWSEVSEVIGRCSSYKSVINESLPLDRITFSIGLIAISTLCTLPHYYH